MNNYLALRLGEDVDRVVLAQSKKHKVDLNSVIKFTPDMIQVGYTKTGLIILIRTNNAGKRIETFVNDNCVFSELVQLNNFSERFKAENPTVQAANNNGYFIHPIQNEPHNGSPKQIANDLGYVMICINSTCKALYDDHGVFLMTGDYHEILKYLRGVTL